jgi:hypothetical protein
MSSLVIKAVDFFTMLANSPFNDDCDISILAFTRLKPSGMPSEQETFTSNDACGASISKCPG